MINLYLSVIDTDDDKNQFEQLYIKYKDKMYSIAYGILHNIEDSEDAVHQAFLTIANNFEKIKFTINIQYIKNKVTMFRKIVEIHKKAFSSLFDSCKKYIL